MRRLILALLIAAPLAALAQDRSTALDKAYEETRAAYLALQDAEGRTYNVFHVEEAPDSPYIPAQEEFVRPFGVRSVVGFGGLVRDELFAVVLFSRVPVPRASADRFRTIALDVKSALHGLGQVPVLEGAGSGE